MSAQQSLYAQPQIEPREPAGLPRLLAGIPAHGALQLPRHEALHGPLPSARPRRRGGEPELIAELEQAGLRGRGGAAFPTAAKMRAVLASRGRAVVLVNAAEGEPASRKDRTLTRALPHLVLDGGELAAEALGANELVVGICESAQGSVESLAMAIAERRQRGRRSLRTRLLMVPNTYVAGQESALVNHASGGPALPTFTPPLPFQRGVSGRPTLVVNAETLAHLALIARHGARWFRELGTVVQPGSALVTLSGAVSRPGVYEISLGEPLPGLIEAAGGLTSQPLAVLLGGYGGSWVAAEHLPQLALADEQLAYHGAALGAGVVHVLGADSCPVAEIARLAYWLSAQSARQCGPCVNGLDAIAASLGQIAGPGNANGALQRVAHMAELVRGRGACGHPDGAARMILSAATVFAGDLADHAEYGPCELCQNPQQLPLTGQ